MTLGLTEDQVRKILRQQCEAQKKERGFGLRAWCRLHNVAQTHASDFLSGRRGPPDDVLRALGFEWRIVPKT